MRNSTGFNLTVSKKAVMLALAALLLVLIIPPALAHTPLNPGHENHTLESALDIPNPTKSWTLYRKLHEANEPEYFQLQLKAGERVKIGLYTPKAEDPNFLPTLVVMGPEITSNHTLPELLDVPNDAGFTVIQAQRREKPEYEPFTPASYYYLADFDRELQSDGTYYFAIYDSTREGRLGIAVGYKEEFALVEWLRIPLDVIDIHQWEGQTLAFIITPMLVTFAVGFGIIVWKWGGVPGARRLIGILAGLLYLGSGVMMLVQMIIALNGAAYDSLAILTLLFVLIPLLLGMALLKKLGLKKEALSRRDRLIVLGLAALGLFSWSGLLIGPILAALASLLR
jgi:hypothetical protein